jgi:hypothetical protein
MLIVRVGLDRPEINAGIDTFVKEASAKNVTLDYMTHPGGRHGFDLTDDVARSREIIKRTVEFIQISLSSD